jgi:hypothetical protein
MSSIILGICILLSILTVYVIIALAVEKRYKNDITRLIFISFITSLAWGVFHYIITI